MPVLPIAYARKSTAMAGIARINALPIHQCEWESPRSLPFIAMIAAPRPARTLARAIAWIAGSDQAKFLIFKYYRSKNRDFEALNRHFHAPKLSYKALVIPSVQEGNVDSLLAFCLFLRRTICLSKTAI